MQKVNRKKHRSPTQTASIRNKQLSILSRVPKTKYLSARKLHIPTLSSLSTLAKLIIISISLWSTVKAGTWRTTSAKEVHSKATKPCE